MGTLSSKSQISHGIVSTLVRFEFIFGCTFVV